jgi:ABC-type transporter Mla MlaB component
MDARFLPSPPRPVFTVWGPIARSDLAGLCDRVCGVLAAAAGAPVAVCEVRGVEPDAVTVDALARLQLAARRRGCRVLLRGASPALLQLVAFMGLTDVLAEEPATTPDGAAGRTAGTGSPSPGRT